MRHAEALREEDRRVRELQIVVSLALGAIAQTEMRAGEAWEMVWATRRMALRLFPGKELAFDLIYLPRFLRLLAERYPGSEAARFS
jgi:hypothetical protein